MPFNHLAVFVFVGTLFQTSLSQYETLPNFSSNQAGNPSQIQVVEDPGTVNVEVDEDSEENDVMTRLGSVTTMEDFIGLMQIHGRPVTDEDIYDDMVNENGKQVISGGGRLALPDTCSPRNTTVRITMEGTDSDVAFFPRCTRIERCGGCCPSPNLECRPLYTERVSLRVVMARVPYPGATFLSYTGFAPIILDRHVTCRLTCTLTAEQCGPNKRFYQEQCMCKCRSRDTVCPPPLAWDTEDCACKCPAVANCCEDGTDCGMVFNHDSCECVLDNSGDGRMSISAGGVRNGTIALDQPMTQRPATTTTTTTTTTAPTTTTTSAPVDPCTTRRCPRNFRRVRANGRCLCRPNRPRGGRPRG